MYSYENGSCCLYWIFKIFYTELNTALKLKRRFQKYHLIAISVKYKDTIPTYTGIISYRGYVGAG